MNSENISSLERPSQSNSLQASSSLTEEKMTQQLSVFNSYEEYLDAHLVEEDLYYLKVTTITITLEISRSDVTRPIITN